jgi:hypothetical protein
LRRKIDVRIIIETVGPSSSDVDVLRLGRMASCVRVDQGYTFLDESLEVRVSVGLNEILQFKRQENGEYLSIEL